MIKPNWNEAPRDAQYYIPASRTYLAGWYKQGVRREWYFAEEFSDEWIPINAPTTHRKNKMERRP